MLLTTFDQLLIWLSRRRLAAIKSDVREEQRLRRQFEAEYGAPIIHPHHISSNSLSSRHSDTGSDDSTLLLPDVRLVDRTRAQDPMHRPPDPRSAARPRSILKTNSQRSKDGKDGRDGKDGNGASLWQRSRGWFSLPARLSGSISSSTSYRKEGSYPRQSSSLKQKRSGYSRFSSPPSPSPSTESDELPARQLKQVRFPVHGMTVKYLYNADRPIQPNLHFSGDGESPLSTDTILALGTNPSEVSAYMTLYNTNSSLTSAYVTDAHDDVNGLDGYSNTDRLVSITEGEEVNLNDNTATSCAPSARRRTPSITNTPGLMALHPSGKGPAQAAISMDSAHAVSNSRDSNDVTLSTSTDTTHVHTPRELSMYYRQACRVRDERPIDSVLKQLKASY
jgi:hypothetical protein